MAGTSNIPFGNAFIVETPRIDEMSQRLIAQQAQRQAYISQENKEMDAMLRKELTNVRSIDSPDVMNLYNQWKQTRSKLYFDPSVSADPRKYNETMQQSNAIYGDLNHLIQQSAEANTAAKEIAKARFQDPDKFVNNAGELVTTYMNTPVRQLDKTKFGDLRDPWSAMRYTGPDTDFQKFQKAAAGTPQQTYAQEAPVDAAGLQTSITPYKFTAAPAQYKSSLMGAISTQHKASDDAGKLYRALPQSEKDRVDQLYQQMPSEKWQQMTGQTTPQDLEPAQGASDAEKYVSYLAKKYAVEGTPEKGTPVFRTNMSAEMKAKQANELALEAYRQNHRIDLAKLKQSLKDKSAEDQNTALGNYVNIIHDEAVKRGDISYDESTGQPVAEYTIPTDPTLNNLFKKGTGKEAFDPDGYRTDATGTYIRPIYYQRTTTGTDKSGNPIIKVKTDESGNPVVDKQLSQPVPVSQFKVALGQKILSKKDESKELRGSGAAKITYKVGNMNYTHEQLNHMGYSDAQIDQAIQLGTIKK